MTEVSCFSVTLFYSTLFCCGGKANLVWFTSFTLLSQPLQTDRLTDGLTDRETNTLTSCGLEEPAHASPGLEELFLQLCCCVSFWFWREIGFGFTYYLCTQGIVPYSCGVVLVFWFWQEIVFGVTYVLSVQYSCAVVLVLRLWREIVLKMITPFHKKILLGYFFMIRQPMSVFYKT